MKFDYIGMLGGLALFLYGMSMMSEGLENAMGQKMAYVLERLTDTKWKAVLIGTIVTALIQSSSAMTVMLIGFVNARLMTLQRAVWVVLGANIGTTITGQMLTLDVARFAPFLAIIGVVLILTSKYQNGGQAIGGVGLLFMGLEMMSLSLTPLKNSTFFLALLQYASYPLTGILIGSIFTGIIQSSSASIGILQALAKQGIISLQQAAYLIFGFDIGTCVTGLIASISGNKNSQRLALFHLIINIFGTIVFSFFCMWTPMIDIMASFNVQVVNQIANFHTFFNVGTTLLVLICDRFLLKVVYWLLPLKNEY